MYEALDAGELLRWELRQQSEVGRDVSHISSSLPAGARLDDPAVEAAFGAAAAAPLMPGGSYQEPDDLAGIVAAADWHCPAEATELDEWYAARVSAAWTGRVAGNMLGKPVESGDEWTPEVIEAFLRSQDAWPLRDYFPPATPLPSGPAYRENWPETTTGNVDGSSRDDDVDYTILNLHILRHKGPGFSTTDVASAWLCLLPFLQTFTAERAAIRNLIEGRRVEQAATFRNPYREWIGAAIRADVFGYVCPGDPIAAATLAYKDAALSHVGNGIYGEMWAAALVSAAFTASSAREAVDRSLAVVPGRSRLYAAVDEVRRWFDEGLSWGATRKRIEESVGHYSWVHTVNNAAVLAAGLLYGDGDFTDTIGLTVCGGWDTDSNGGTGVAGGGIRAGARGNPSQWRQPLHDRVRSAVFGYDGSSITRLAAHTVEVARALRDHHPPVEPDDTVAASVW